MKRNARSTIALVAATTLAVSVAAVAQAAPVDIGDDYVLIPKANVVWTSSSWWSQSFGVEEATIYPDTVDPADPEAGTPVNSDTFDGALRIWVEEEWYGFPDGEGNFVVDVTTAGGDTLVQGPPEVLSGLTVSVQHRYYADGDLARVLASFTNATATPISVFTGAYSDYGSDGHTVVEGDSSGDGNVSEVDHWIITGGEGSGTDPIITTAWSKTGASRLPVWAGLVTEGDESEVEFDLTVQPGQTVHLAYFVKIHGYTSDEPDGPGGEPFSIVDSGELTAAALIADDYAAAVAAAVTDAAEFNTFTGRLTAGLAPGTVVLNWGTIPAAPAGPATPVTGRPSFTG